MCEKSLFRDVSVKSLCIVSGSLHFFFLLVSLFLVLLYLMEDGAAREVQRDLLLSVFLLFHQHHLSVALLPAGVRGVQVQLPHIPRTHFWVSLRGPSSSQAQVTALSTLSSGY